MKKALSLCLALLMVLSLIPITASAAEVINITSAAQLASISSDLTASYKLMNNIDLSDYGNWTPIGGSTAFSGEFEGNGKKITGLSCVINGTGTSTYAGLFGNVSGTVKNVSVSGTVSATANTTATSNVYAGGVVGYVSGWLANIEGCTSTCTVTASLSCASSSWITPSGNAYAGGIVGLSNSWSEISECAHTNGKVSATANMTSKGNSNAYAGGIAGKASGTICDCYNTEEISATATKSSGSSAEAYVGGIAGVGSSFATSYNTGKLTASGGTASYNGGIAGSLSGKSTNCYYSTKIADKGYGKYTGSSETAPTATGLSSLTNQKCAGFDYNAVWSSGPLSNPSLYPRDKVISGSVSVTGSFECGSTLSADVSKIEPSEAQENLKYQWYRGAEDADSDNTVVYTAIDGATKSTYTLTKDDIGKYVQVKAKGTYIKWLKYGYAGSITSTGKMVEKLTPATPAAPVIKSYTDSSITVTPVSGAMYGYATYNSGFLGIGAGYGTPTWQTSNVISGLKAETKYGIYVKIAASETTNESAVSAVTEITTRKVGEDPVSSISVKTKPSKVSYYVGDTLNTAGLILSAKYESGATGDVSTGFTCSPTTLSTTGTQTITVTYDGKTTSFTVSVAAVTLSSISVKTNPSKTTYYVGDTLNTAGLVLNLNNNNGSVSTASSGFTCSPTTLNTVGTQKITVTYKGKTTSFNVTVNEPAMSKIAIKTNPTKVSYFVGDTLNTAGLSLTATYESGATKTITSGFTCTPTSLSKAGTQTITVSYSGKTATFNVTVSAVTLESIAVKTKPSKVSYFVGDTLNTTGLSLSLTYNNGTVKTVTSGFTCTPTKLSTAGTQTIAVSYSGKTASFNVTVTPVQLSSISVKTAPVKTNYFTGDTLDTNGLSLTLSYNNGTTSTLTGGFTCTPTTLSTAGTQKVIVTYSGKTTYFNVTVTAVAVSSVEIKTMPSKLNYYEDDMLSTDGLTLTVNYNNGDVKTVDKGFSCYPTQLSTPGTQRVTASYMGKTAEFDVTVAALKITSIAINTKPSKVKYATGDKLSVSGLTLTATYENGVKKTIETGFTCTPGSFTTIGTKTVTVTYKDKTTSFKVSVSLKTPSVSVSNASKTVAVKWAKVLDATGYVVYRKAGSAKSWTKLATIKKGTTVSYTDKSVKSGTTYTYTVKAYKGSVYSSAAKSVKIKFLLMPTVKIANSGSGITLKWNKITGASGYYIYKWNGTKWTRIATLSSKSLSYTDKTVKSGKTAKYTIRAYSGSTLSAYNKTGYTYKFISAPKLSSAASSKTGITFKWGKVSAASGYYVYRKAGSAKSWTKIATVKGATKVSYLDKSAKKGTTYTYTVVAYSGSYRSSYYGGVKCKDKY